MTSHEAQLRYNAELDLQPVAALNRSWLWHPRLVLYCQAFGHGP